MTIKNKTEILPGWTLFFDEVSNNVYKVTLTDEYGRQASTTDTDLEEAIKTAENYAFDIEKQISKNWNKFLFDTCVLKLGDTIITEKHYHNEVFGSWYLVLDNKRLVLDGKDFILNIQVFKDDNWVNIEEIKMSDLTFDNFVKAILSTH